MSLTYEPASEPQVGPDNTYFLGFYAVAVRVLTECVCRQERPPPLR